MPSRVGIGFDSHRLTEGRSLILGGVEVPFEKGLAGHSDGDVLTHALMDALLGAANLGDKGQHFPPSDQQYKGVSSLLLLKQVGEMLAKKRWQVLNTDATMLAQQPALSPFIPEMKREISVALSISEANVSIKATTTDHMGFIGRGEGITAYAVVLLGGIK